MANIGVVMLGGVFGATGLRAQSSQPAEARPIGPVPAVSAPETPSKTEKLPVLAAPAAEHESPFSLTLKAGASYDSDVAISQTNTSTGQSDYLGNLSLSTSYKPLSAHGRSLTLGYDYSQSLHRELSQFDIQLHSGSLTGSAHVGKSYLGLTYSFNHILLGGHPFLDMHFTSPSILTPLSPKIFARASFVYLDETFLTDRKRDAKHSQPGLQLFYFFNHAHSFVLLGANYQREKTVGPEFTYKGYALDASISLPFKLLKKTGKIKAEYGWISRDYDNITPSIGANRFDRSSTYKLSAEVPLFRKLSLGLEARHVSRSSNLRFANLDENTAGADLILRF
jgi:hypothetical protein